MERELKAACDAGITIQLSPDADGPTAHFKVVVVPVGDMKWLAANVKGQSTQAHSRQSMLTPLISKQNRHQLAYLWLKRLIQGDLPADSVYSTQSRRVFKQQLDEFMHGNEAKDITPAAAAAQQGHAQTQNPTFFSDNDGFDPLHATLRLSCLFLRDSAAEAISRDHGEAGGVCLNRLADALRAISPSFKPVCGLRLRFRESSVHLCSASALQASDSLREWKGASALNLSVIGRQAHLILHASWKLVDCLAVPNESSAQQLRRAYLSERGRVARQLARCWSAKSVRTRDCRSSPSSSLIVRDVFSTHLTLSINSRSCR